MHKVLGTGTASQQSHMDKQIFTKVQAVVSHANSEMLF